MTSNISSAGWSVMPGIGIEPPFRSLSHGAFFLALFVQLAFCNQTIQRPAVAEHIPSRAGLVFDLVLSEVPALEEPNELLG